MRTHDAGRSADLGRDDLELIFRQAKDIDFNVDSLVDTEFRAHPPGQDVQILEALDDSSNDAGIRVGNDPKSEQGT